MVTQNITTELRNDWNFEKSVNFTNKLLLIDSPGKVLLIWILYIVVILKTGPNFMKNRPAFKLDRLILIYNTFQVGASLYIVYLGVPILLKEELLPKCLYDRESAVGYLSLLHFYFLIKITELLDTVFFILRKKNNQASFLHIYHHTYALLSVWATIKYDPSYVNVFPSVFNSSIHVVMYTYYGMAMFPKLAKYLWWKKYITTMQLIQFIIIFCYMLTSYLYAECPPSPGLAFSMLANMVIFLGLFSNFYNKSYRKQLTRKDSGKVMVNTDKER